MHAYPAACGSVHLPVCLHALCMSGPWLNIKMSSYRYRKSHCGDKTVIRSSYLHNGISYTTSIGNPIVVIRRSKDRLISTMGFPILVRWHLYTESPSWIQLHNWQKSWRNLTMKWLWWFHKNAYEILFPTDQWVEGLWLKTTTKMYCNNDEIIFHTNHQQ